MVSTTLFQSTLPRGERRNIIITFYHKTWKFQSTLPRGERRASSAVNFSPFSISIHAPARGATLFQFIAHIIYQHFNPRSREGSDDSLHQNEQNINNFNPRSREGSDYDKVVTKRDEYKFQSTLPRGERLSRSRTGHNICTDFNPRSREGSDFLLSVLIVQFRISIHAPARGATHRIQLVIRISIISIHAPARGATRVRLVCCRRLAISIHAPARGATAPAQTVKSYTVDFNPRSREGSDHTSHNGGIFVIISIHAPARGATFGVFIRFFFIQISIHAPARGATEVKNGNFQTMSDFNPRSREGSDAARKMTAYEGL